MVFWLESHRSDGGIMVKLADPHHTTAAELLGWQLHADVDDSHSQALLDPQELAVDMASTGTMGVPGTTPTYAERFRHSGWKNARSRVYSAMLATRQSVSRIARFVSCGDDAWILRSLDDPDKFRIATTACHDKFCVPCARDRSRVITHNICDFLAAQPCRFVTLTLKGGEVDLAFGIDRLLRCFRRLRQRTFWRRRVKGGVAFVEFKWSGKSQAWHVHLHAITHGRYLPQPDLAAEWRACTGDSYIVDVRFVRDDSTVAKYVSKYVTKPIDSADSRSHDRLCEAITATHRRRLVIPFGDWIDIGLTASPAEGEWIVVGDLESVARRAAAGDLDASAALHAVLSPQDVAVLIAAAPHALERSPPAQPPPEQMTFTWPLREIT
jgi:hypothetical protein